MTSRSLNYGKYIGKPAIPLSPHNSEISDKDAIADQNYLGLNDVTGKPGKKNKRKGVHVPKGANREDHSWETKIWNYLNAPTAKLKWSRSVDLASGQRSFRDDDALIAIECSEGDAGGLEWSNRSDGWKVITVYRGCADERSIAVLGGVIDDLISRASR